MTDLISIRKARNREKFVSARAPKPAREGACAPQISEFVFIRVDSWLIPDPLTFEALCLHFCHMGQTITFRPTKKLAGWIEQTAARIGVSQGKLIRDHLERARQSDNGTRKFMRFAGVLRGGPRNLSTRKGFSKK